MSDFAILVSGGFPTHVAVIGELDIATVSQVDAAFALLTGDVDVDCTDLSFVDSAGFYAFDRGYEAATTRGSTFELSGLSGIGARVGDLLAVPYVSRAVPRAA
jgi:anti-anti-sigma regulatory factor